MKKKIQQNKEKYHTVGKITKFNRNIKERGKLDTSNTLYITASIKTSFTFIVSNL